MASHIGNIAFSAFMLLISAYLWFVADAFPTFEKYKNIDSDFWPKILMLMIGIFSLGVLYQSIAALREHLRKRPSGAPASEKKPARVDWKRFCIMAGLCIGYFYGLQTLGFLISTIIFLSISVHFIGLEGKFLRLFYPLIFTGCLTFLFVRLLDLSLPRGQWIFREFSLLFY